MRRRQLKRIVMECRSESHSPAFAGTADEFPVTTNQSFHSTCTRSLTVETRALCWYRCCSGIIVHLHKTTCLDEPRRLKHARRGFQNDERTNSAPFAINMEPRRVWHQARRGHCSHLFSLDGRACFNSVCDLVQIRRVDEVESALKEEKER